MKEFFGENAVVPDANVIRALCSVGWADVAKELCDSNQVYFV